MGKYSNLICMDLVERIEEYIEQKGLKPGDKLPSERDFCDILKVSRMTARDALKKMCDEGILYSYHGGGTFVSPKKRKRDISHIVSSSGTGYGEEGPIKVKIISVKINRADVRVTR